MQPSRYEINHHVRGVLVRHAVDMHRLSYSCTGATVYLYGELKKEPEGDFSPDGVESVATDLSRIPGVKGLQFELDNWTISSNLSSWDISRRQYRETRDGGQQSFTIERSERLQDVINEIIRKQAEKKKPST
jgi:hypothetical protein